MTTKNTKVGILKKARRMAKKLVWDMPIGIAEKTAPVVDYAGQLLYTPVNWFIENHSRALRYAQITGETLEIPPVTEPGKLIEVLSRVSQLSERQGNLERISKILKSEKVKKSPAEVYSDMTNYGVTQAAINWAGEIETARSRRGGSDPAMNLLRFVGYM